MKHEHPFKVGDVVRCVDDEEVQRAFIGKLKKGRTYRIHMVSNDIWEDKTECVFLTRWPKKVWLASRFKAATDASIINGNIRLISELKDKIPSFA